MLKTLLPLYFLPICDYKVRSDSFQCIDDACFESHRHARACTCALARTHTFLKSIVSFLEFLLLNISKNSCVYIYSPNLSLAMSITLPLSPSLFGTSVPSFSGILPIVTIILLSPVPNSHVGLSYLKLSSSRLYSCGVFYL